MSTLSQAIERAGIDPDTIDIEMQLKLVWHRPYEAISGPCHEFVPMPARLTLVGPADASGARPALLRIENTATELYPGEADAAGPDDEDHRSKRLFTERGNDAYWNEFTTVTGPLNEQAGPEGILRSDLHRLVHEFFENGHSIQGTLGLSPVLFVDRNPADLSNRENENLLTLGYGRLKRYVAADMAVFDALLSDSSGDHDTAIYERNRLCRPYIDNQYDRPTHDLLRAASRNDRIPTPFSEFASWFWRSERNLVDLQDPPADRVTQPRISAEGRKEIIELAQRCQAHYAEQSEADFTQTLCATVKRALQVHPLHRDMANATVVEIVKEMRRPAAVETAEEASSEKPSRKMKGP